MKRYMLKFNFWLDINKQDEYEIAETVEVLKQQRTFSKTIRDGIQLINDLRQGKIEVLLELFPWVKDQIALEIRAEQPETLPSATVLQEQLDRMEQLLLQQGAIPVEMGTRPTQMPVPRLPEPSTPDDMDFEIKQAGRDENNNSTFNFLIAGAINVQGHCNDLKPEIVEYGLRTGRIPASMVKPAKTVMGNPKAMDVPQFDVPNFEDDFVLDLIDTG